MSAHPDSRKTASAYILRVPKERRWLLHGVHKSTPFGEQKVAEPVPVFDHSKNVPLVVLASFEDGVITHVADGRKGASAGTGLVRLNLESLQRLQQPLSFETLLSYVPIRVRHHLARALNSGGKLPPKTLGAVVDALLELDPALAERLARFSDRRAQAIADLSASQRENLAIQKETVGVALEIAGVDRGELLQWMPSEAPGSFLDGLPEAYVREDVMLLSDFSTMPGFRALEGATHVAVKTFVDPYNSRNRLRVVMANRLGLEEQTGADLIYYNETYRSFVMVQYKAMEKGRDGPEFRWKAGDQLGDEISRMDRMLAELEKVEADVDPDGFRFSGNPFFLKFCSRVVFNPDDKGLFSGMYLPLGLWKDLVSGDRLKGARGGNVLTYGNVGRYLTNSEFVVLVSKAWVGTTIRQSQSLEPLIRSVLATGKTLTYAVESPPHRGAGLR